MLRIYMLLLLVMLMWGLNVSALKVLVGAVDPILLTAFRIMTAGVAVLIICLAMGIFRLPRKDEWFTIFFIAIFNVILHHSFVAVGLTKTSGINAGLILGMVPLVTVMMTVIFLRQRVRWLRILGFILGFVGVAVTTLAGAGGIKAVSPGGFDCIFGCCCARIQFCSD